MRKILKSALLGLTLVVLGGCAIGQMGNKISSSNIEKLKKGITTKQEVVTMLGEPSEIQISKDGLEAWRYSYSGPKVYSVLISEWITGNGNISSYESSESQDLTLYFRNDVLREYRFSASGGSEGSKRSLHVSGLSW